MHLSRDLNGWSWIRKIQMTGWMKKVRPRLLMHNLKKYASPLLTKILVCQNQLGDEGATILCNALREIKVHELDLSQNDIGSCGATSVASVVASLTKVR